MSMHAFSGPSFHAILLLHRWISRDVCTAVRSLDWPHLLSIIKRHVSAINTHKDPTRPALQRGDRSTSFHWF